MNALNLASTAGHGAVAIDTSTGKVEALGRSKAGHATRKKPAQLTREINEVLRGRSHATRASSKTGVSEVARSRRFNVGELRGSHIDYMEPTSHKTLAGALKHAHELQKRKYDAGRVIVESVDVKKHGVVYGLRQSWLSAIDGSKLPVQPWS